MPFVIDGIAHSAEKRFRVGTHRVCSPEETVEFVRPHYERLGITRIADISGLDRIPISTVVAHRPNSRTLAAGSGKGFTKAAATASAVMEAAEMYHAEYADLAVVRASHDELTRHARVVGVDDLPLTVNNIFAADRPERWTPGWDLVSGETIHVPTDLVDLSPRHGTYAHQLSFQIGSNGLASGNVLLEAVLAATYECVERDATTSWKLAQARLGVPPPTVDLSTVPYDTVNDLMDRLGAVGVELDLYDCTIDTDVPTFFASIGDRGHELGRYGGYGTHLDPEVAMLRAITEAVQGRVVYVAGSRDDLFDHARYSVNRSSPHPFAFSAADVEWRDASGYVSEATDTFEDDLAIVLERLQRAGLPRAIVVDLSKAELGIPVVRVIVPGLEGYAFPYYRPGRRAEQFVDRIRAKEPSHP